MIISAAHDFGFVHIPKCAGSTIRHQLREQDDLGGRFYHTMTLPDIGRINGNHVPLDLLDSHFPEVLEQLRAVTSYATVREPLKRFISAVAQYLRSHTGEPAGLSEADILRETSRIIAGIQADTGRRDIRNTIFYRQADFVYLRGERVVGHVYAVENMEKMLERIAAVHGLELRGDTVWNPTVTYRVSGLSGALKRINSASRRILPRNTYVALRDFGIKTLTTKGVPVLEKALHNSREVQTFVAGYYAADLDLYRETVAAHAPADAS